MPPSSTARWVSISCYSTVRIRVRRQRDRDYYFVGSTHFAGLRSPPGIDIAGNLLDMVADGHLSPVPGKEQPVACPATDAQI